MTEANRIPIDVFESDENYLLRADVPGVADGDVEINLHKGELSLVARRGEELFKRSLRFADRIDADAVEAQLADGVLELKLPKAAEVRPRKIPVRITG
jgi:HSP20 family protein